MSEEKRSFAQMSSVLRSFEILESVAELQPVSLRDLVARFKYSKSTIQRTLTTLESAGWLRQTDSSSWEVSARSTRVRPRVLTETDLLERARGPMQELMEQTGETIHLSLLNGYSNVILIGRADSDQPVRTFSPLGDISPLHATSIGKAVLAHFPPTELEEYLAAPLQKYTDATIVDTEALRQELAEIRTRGYSVNRREYRPTVASIGAPILAASGDPIGGICISMPDSRFREEQVDELGQRTRSTAEAISAFSVIR